MTSAGTKPSQDPAAGRISPATSRTNANEGETVESNSGTPQSEVTLEYAKGNVVVSALENGQSDPAIAEKRASHIDSLKTRVFGSGILKSAIGRISDGQPRPWRTSWVRFGPLSGIFAMCLAIACIIASLGILAGSDGQPVTSWSAPPSTYLAIFTAIANLSMRYAAIQGVVIAWWFRASKGSTLAKLHWDWRSGTTLRGALTAGRHMGLLGLACIFSTLVVMDGPLLQRSSTVIRTGIGRATTLHVSMAAELPTGFSGSWDRASGGPKYPWAIGFNGTIPTNNGEAPNHVAPFTSNDVIYNVASRWHNDIPMDGIISGCPGICKAKLKAPALFATECTHHLVDLDYLGPFNETSYEASSYAPPLNHVGFLITSPLVVKNSKESITLITGYSATTMRISASGQRDCPGTFNYTICTLESAIAEYDVTVDANRVTLDAPGEPQFLALANNSAVDTVWRASVAGRLSTLAGVASLMYNKFYTEVFFYVKSGFLYGSNLGAGIGYEQWLVEGDGKCPSFRDPKEQWLRAANKLMVYIGAYAAKSEFAYLESRMDADLPVNTTITGHATGEEDVFNTAYGYFLAAALVEVVCIALIAPTYWGWWTIGRPVSFSPLEMAKAFESPLLADSNSNSTGRDLANNAGEYRVRYGVIQDDATTDKERLAFGDPAIVTSPRQSMRFES